MDVTNALNGTLENAYVTYMFTTINKYGGKRGFEFVAISVTKTEPNFKGINRGNFERLNRR